MWRRTFLSVSALAGEPLDVAWAAIGSGASRDQAEDAATATLAAELGSPQKAVRAQTLARELAKLVRVLEREVVR